jgi:hypothetical protein
MKVHGAVVKEQGVTFAIVVVKRHILNIRTRAHETAEAFSRLFPGVPIVLMAQDGRGIPTYFGRKDIVRFLSKIDHRIIPWKEYTFAA